MPVKLSSRHTDPSEARIEIIPLIDIMFFLLAAFMLVSLSMVNSRSVKVDLPTATTSSNESHHDFVSLSVDADGTLFLDQKPIGHHELISLLTSQRRTNASVRVYIHGDRSARHGDIIRALDLVRSAGIDKVAFETRENPKSSPP